ncbi:hypothetical protein BEN30_17005 [Magnetovibrio blakemorei]|uniref:Methyltransferase FkbM domain-containing protein n=2 Tax=Magnetovibrio blakemorei TaxID=28181 RepID=A0A1E5Q3D8_9PROT|nr:hypothetical protein BEN30_17005 [Magnetovibrio blakemorei]
MVVFDVGANTGHWSSACAQLFDEETNIYAFEPGLITFGKLKQYLKHKNNIHVFQIGLSKSDGEMEIMISDSVSEKSSVEVTSASALLPHIKDFRKETQKFVRGDVFCSDLGINHIDFLKVDTEGHDFHVVSGFGDMIKNKEIDVIQFEYNRLNIFTKIMLRDFYVLLNEELTDKGFCIGRIYPGGVWFKEYSVYDENFVDGNFLAVRINRTDLISVLSV